jgi:beta-aspartyl-peptidase (threonine type)
MGGTSAGAVSLGEAAFDADEGTVTSQAALQNPLSSLVSVTYPSFAHPKLQNALVDSHFSQRDREGRLLAFLARFLEEKAKSQVVGIGLDEGVALVLDESGFRVMGPSDGAVWVYRVTGPAGLSDGEPLELEGILRVRLEPGAEGEWPLDFQAFSGVELRVSGGVLGPA